MPNKTGESKLRIIKNDKEWIACHRYEWWERCRLSPKQADRAIGILTKAHLVEVVLHRFKGEVTPHIRLNWDAFLAHHQKTLARPSENPFLPKGKIEITQTSKSILTKRESPLTEITSETTTPSKPKRETHDYDDVPKPDRLDIIKAYADSLPVPPTNPYNRDANHSAAAVIFREGYRAHQVTLFVKAKKAEDYWQGKTLTLAKVSELMPEWLAHHFPRNGNGAPKSVPPPPQLPPARRWTQEELERIKSSETLKQEP